jgi:hypothetical protein
MNPQECELAYRKLTAMLEEHQFSWVIEQLDEALQAGDVELPDKKRSPTIIEDFSPQKKLKYLIDTIEQSIVNTADMEQEISSFLENDVAFYPDVENSQASFLINQNTIHERRRKSVNCLRELLTSLKTRIAEDGRK